LRGTLLKNIKINRHIERKNLVGQVIEKMCGEADVKVEELRGRNQRRRVAEVRPR
jgi:chromosomal replication initiation ATPase DnaA